MQMPTSRSRAMTAAVVPRPTRVSYQPWPARLANAASKCLASAHPTACIRAGDVDATTDAAVQPLVSAGHMTTDLAAAGTSTICAAVPPRSATKPAALATSTIVPAAYGADRSAAQFSIAYISRSNAASHPIRGAFQTVRVDASNHATCVLSIRGCKRRGGARRRLGGVPVCGVGKQQVQNDQHFVAQRDRQRPAPVDHDVCAPPRPRALGGCSSSCECMLEGIHRAGAGHEVQRGR